MKKTDKLNIIKTTLLIMSKNISKKMKTCKMTEKICKSYIVWFSIQNIQRIHTIQKQKDKKIRLIGQGFEYTFLQRKTQMVNKHVQRQPTLPGNRKRR
jgi:hypothetical protein